MFNYKYLMAQLGRRIDRADRFMDRPNIQKDRSHPGNFERRIPDWALSDVEVQKILTRSFPRATERGRARMAKWCQVIVLHYRMHYPISRIAAEMNESKDAIRNILQRIRNAARGLTTDGQPRKRLKAKPESVKRSDRRRRQRDKVTAAEVLRKLFLRPLKTGRRLVWPDENTNSKRGRRIPDWSRDENKIAALIVKSFPRWRTDRHQRSQAWLWYHIILLYYGTTESRRRFFDADQNIRDQQWSRKNIASVLEITDRQLRSALERINRSAVGLNTAGQRRKLSQSH